jgi:hypothetical protein
LDWVRGDGMEKMEELGYRILVKETMSQTMIIIEVLTNSALSVRVLEIDKCVSQTFCCCDKIPYETI